MNPVSDLILNQPGLTFSNPIEDDDLQIQIGNVSAFIRKNYSTFLSNVARLEDAQIICLGEIHRNDLHRKINAQIINFFYTEDSVLLIEASNDNLENCMQAKYVEQPIKIDGWDIQINKKARDEVGEFIRADIISKGPKPYHFVNLSKLQELNDSVQNPRSNCGLTTSICSVICRMCCAIFFVNVFKPCIQFYYQRKQLKGLQKIINEFPLRNRKMCESIQRELGENKKVFVIAGSKHFQYTSSMKGIDARPCNRAVAQTMNFLSTKRFAILIPFSPEPKD